MIVDKICGTPPTGDKLELMVQAGDNYACVHVIPALALIDVKPIITQ